MRARPTYVPCRRALPITPSTTSRSCYLGTSPQAYNPQHRTPCNKNTAGRDSIGGVLPQLEMEKAFIR